MRDCSSTLALLLITQGIKKQNENFGHLNVYIPLLKCYGRQVVEREGSLEITYTLLGSERRPSGMINRRQASSSASRRAAQFRKSLCDPWLSFLKALGRRIQRSNGLQRKRTCARDTTN
ncbi:unnamed protein product [Trichogramma brassicae]|uniref:Uncharacterized protein n=1 Tax=Trichogramma brassicae TaxID=86971 RepID=A0A6H5IL35_9HYME|nr:unnamed protein product [Trichogramma brassicae]